MHGAEHPGNAALYQLLNYLESNDIKGSIRIIPTANPLAINTKIGPNTIGTFNAWTGDNWNLSYYNFTVTDVERGTRYCLLYTSPSPRDS